MGICLFRFLFTVGLVTLLVRKFICPACINPFLFIIGTYGVFYLTVFDFDFLF